MGFGVICAKLFEVGAPTRCLAHAAIGRVPGPQVAVEIAMAQAVTVEAHHELSLRAEWDNLNHGRRAANRQRRCAATQGKRINASADKPCFAEYEALKDCCCAGRSPLPCFRARPTPIETRAHGEPKFLQRANAAQKLVLMVKVNANHKLNLKRPSALSTSEC